MSHAKHVYVSRLKHYISAQHTVLYTQTHTSYYLDPVVHSPCDKLTTVHWNFRRLFDWTAKLFQITVSRSHIREHWQYSNTCVCMSARWSKFDYNPWPLLVNINLDNRQALLRPGTAPSMIMEYDKPCITLVPLFKQTLCNNSITGLSLYTALPNSKSHDRPWSRVCWQTNYL